MRLGGAGELARVSQHVAELGLECRSLDFRAQALHASRTLLPRVEVSNYVKGTSTVSSDFGRTLCNFDFASRFIFKVQFLLYNLLF